MNNQIFEEEGKAPVAGMATAQQKIEKQARQLAYDTRYQVKKEIGDKKVNPAAMKRFLMQRLQKSTAAPNVKVRAKQMLLGEDYIGDVADFAAGTVANALFKVFVEGTQQEVSEEIELQYLKELEEKKERKYKVRVTDKNTGNSYVRYATRDKITQLRINPNIQSVEMTEYGEPREGERKSGEDTARATGGGKKAKKDYDGDGKVESPAKEYRGAVHNAIQRKKGGVPDGKDTSSVKEEFLADAATEDSNDKKISTEKVVNNYSGKNPAVKIMPEDPTAQVRKGIYSHYEPKSEVIAETGYSKFLGMIQEKAESEQQQKLFGLALSVKRGETPRSEVSAEVLKIVDTMSEKKIRDFAKTKHEGLPEKVDEECGCEEEPKSSKKGEMDVRELPTKMNMVKNKMRAMGLKMSYEPEGEQIDEIVGPLVKIGLAAGGGALAAKGLQHLQKKANQAINSARQNTRIGGDARVPQRNSYEPEGEVIDERRKEDKVAGTPRKPRDPAFEIVAGSMGAGRLGVEPRGKRKKPGKKPPAAGEYGGPESPAQKVAKRRADAQRAREFEQDTRGT